MSKDSFNANFMMPTITVPNMNVVVEPSAFERGVATELKALAERIESGGLRIKKFSLSVSPTDTSQIMEIEVW